MKKTSLNNEPPVQKPVSVYPLNASQIARKYQVSKSYVQHYANSHDVPFIGSGCRRTFLFDEFHEKAFCNRNKRRGRRWNLKLCIIQHPDDGHPRLFTFYHLKDAFQYTLKNGACDHVYITTSQKFSGQKKGFFNTRSPEEKALITDILNHPTYCGKLYVWAAAPGEKYYFFDNQSIDKLFLVQQFFSLHHSRAATIVQQATGESNENFISRLYEANKGFAAMNLKTLSAEVPHD